MSIVVNDGDSKPINLHYVVIEKSLTAGSMVSWNSSGGSATGKIERIVREGSLNIPNSKFTINAEKDDPAVLIRVYRDNKPTDTLVGHKMSTLNESSVKKHGSHNQSSHGRKGGAGASSSAGGSEDDGSLKVGDDLDGVKNAAGLRVTIVSGENAGKNGRIDSSNADGTRHYVEFQGTTRNRPQGKIFDGKDLRIREGNNL